MVLVPPKHPVLAAAASILLAAASFLPADAQTNVCDDPDAARGTACPFVPPADPAGAGPSPRYGFDRWPPWRGRPAPVHVSAIVSYPALGYDGREREVPVRIRVPTDGPAVPRPIAVFVHGGAEGGEEGDNPLARWADTFVARGYVTVNLVIPARDGGEWIPGVEGERTRLCRALNLCGEDLADDEVADCLECEWFRHLMYDRPHDVERVLSSLEDLRADMAADLKGNPRFDDPVRQPKVLYGHSAGSEGVQSAAGVARDFDYDGIPEVDFSVKFVEAHNIVGVIAASPKGPFSPAASQSPIQPGCGGDRDLEPGCADEDSCFFPFGEEFGGSCVAEPDEPDFVCPYGEPRASPVCEEGPGWGDLCRRVGNLGFGPASWEELTVPTLYLTGAEDFAGGQHPSERRWAAEHPGPSGSYLLWFRAAGDAPCDEADPAMAVDAVLDHNLYAFGEDAPRYFAERMVSAALAFADSVAGGRAWSRLGREYLDNARPMSRDVSCGRVVFGCYE